MKKRVPPALDGLLMVKNLQVLLHELGNDDPECNGLAVALWVHGLLAASYSR